MFFPQGLASWKAMLYITVVYTTMVWDRVKLEDEIKQAQFTDDFMKAILNILVTADRISSATNATLRPFDLSKEQYNVLRILRGQHPNPSTLQLVSERMISKSSNATRLVEKLRMKGLVERCLCPTNRRKVDILITQKGLDLLEELDPLMIENGERMRKITDAEARTLNLILDKMRD